MTRKITKPRLQEAIKFLLHEWEEHDFDSEYVTIDEESSITVQFPSGERTYSFSWDEFVAAIDCARTMEIDVEKGYVKTTSKCYQLVAPANDQAELFDFHDGDISINVDRGVTLTCERAHFLVTFAAVKEEAFHEYYPPENYRGIEVAYGDGSALTRESEAQLIDTFLFELAATQGLLFVRTAFDIYSDPAYDSEEYDLEKEKDLMLRPLESFNQGMRLYLAALQATDTELRFLSLYKVLECFAPVVFALEENDAIRRKLDSPSALNPDGRYIRSVIELVRSLDRRKNDKEIIKSLLGTCVDIVDLSKHLPEGRQRPLTYDDKRNEKDSFTRMLAEVIVSTRNRVAHAKSNYSPQGNEAQLDEIPRFNEFLKLAAEQTIRWYNRLPDHQKILDLQG